MLYRALTGRLTLGFVTLTLAIGAGRFYLRTHRFDSRPDASGAAGYMSQLTPESLVSSTWQYIGPLGEKTLTFNINGSATLDSPETRIEGSWKISQQMLRLELPGSETHIAIFRKSADDLSGFVGTSTDSAWSAFRNQEVQ